MAETMGYLGRMTIAGTAVEFVSADVSETRELLDDEDGIRGVRSRTLERAVQGQIKVGGSIKMNPTPVELALVWPYCVQNSTGATLTDAMQDVTVVLDNIQATNTFLGRFSKVTLAGSPGKKLDLTLDFVGKSNTVTTGGSLSAVPDITVRPYMMQDMGSGITIGGTTYSIDEFELMIDNHIEPTYMQGQTATDLEPQDREVHLKVRTKYTTTEKGLQTTAIAGPALGSPVTGSIAFTNGSNSVTFTFGALVAEPKTVSITDKKHLRWTGQYRAYKVGTTLEVVTVFV